SVEHLAAADLPHQSDMSGVPEAAGMAADAEVRALKPRTAESYLYTCHHRQRLQASVTESSVALPPEQERGHAAPPIFHISERRSYREAARRDQARLQRAR